MSVMDRSCARELETHFASPERLPREALERDVRLVTEHAVVASLLATVKGLVAVLNEHRQILGVNDALIERLGINDAAEVIGLRPGEAIKCAHAAEMAAGCGTGKYCATCGAAIAIMATLDSGAPEEQKCLLTVGDNGNASDMCLRVCASRMTVEGQTFVLLFLQDITAEEWRAALERAFFHDIGNIIMGLQGASAKLVSAKEPQRSEMAARVRALSQRLSHEVAIQRSLASKDQGEFQLWRDRTPVQRIIEEVRALFTTHPAATAKTLAIREPLPDVLVYTDISLAVRVLTNMVANAFEATDRGGDVQLWAEQEGDAMVFHVWNQKAIPEAVALRVFQRHFTTKKGAGRGIGTFAMKLIGEKLLGGKVGFTTSEVEGTVFRFALPL